jgi:hypothetical protein
MKKSSNISFFRSILCFLLLLNIVSYCNDSDELSGFALFERLRQMKVDAQNAMVREDYVKASKIYKKMAQIEKNRARSAAYLLRSADCMMQAKKGHRALEEYTFLLENYPLYVPYEHVVAQLRKLAEWFVNGDGTFLGIRDKETGIKIYELVIREAPAVQVTLGDRLRLAELLVEVGRLEEAVLVYQALLRQDSRNLDVRADLALLLLKISLQGDGDGSKLRAAVREATIVIESDPNHKKNKELRKLLRDAGEEEARRLLTQGEFYLKPAHLRPRSARRYMYDVIKKYPDTKASREAQKLLKKNRHLVEIEREEAMKSPIADVPEKPLPPPPKDQEDKRKDEAKASAKAEKEREDERKRVAEAKEKAEKELRKAEKEKLKEEARQQQIKDEENKKREKQLKKEAEEKQKAEEKRRAELEEAKKQQEKERIKLQKAQEELREREEKQRKEFEKQQKKLERQRQKEQEKELKKQREIQRKKQKELEKQRKEEERKQEELRELKLLENKPEVKTRGTQPEQQDAPKQETDNHDDKRLNERLIHVQKEKEILLKRIQEKKSRLDKPTNEAPAPGKPNALDQGKSQSNGNVKSSGLSQAVSRPAGGVQSSRLNAPTVRQAGNVAAGN